MRDGLIKAAKIATPLAFFAVVAWLVRGELTKLSLDEILATLERISAGQLLLAVAITAVSYLVLTLYDRLGVDYAGARLGYAKVMPTSFVSYVYSLNLGALVGGVGFRYRLYSGWGLGAQTIAKITIFCIVTAWSGYLLVAGVLLLCNPEPLGRLIAWPPTASRLLGATCTLTALAYLLFCHRRAGTVELRGYSYRLPDVRLAAMQLCLASVYWLLPAAAIYNLLPAASEVAFTSVLGAHLLSATAGVIAHIPGGIGVIEGVFLKVLGPEAGASQALALALAFRGVYYLAPLACASVVLGALELLRRHR